MDYLFKRYLAIAFSIQKKNCLVDTFTLYGVSKNQNEAGSPVSYVDHANPV